MKKILRGDELLIVFMLIGDVHFGLEIQKIISIVEPKQRRTIPLSPPYINSIMNYYGSIVTIFDLKTYFAFRSTEDNDEEAKVVYLKHNELNVGLLVDKITGIDYVSLSVIEEPGALDSDFEVEKFCNNVFIINEDEPVVYRLDVEKIEDFMNRIVFPG